MNSIAIIGKGSIGLLTAFELSKSSNFNEIYLFGSNNNLSASYAAGAMLNILSEVDCFNYKSKFTQWKLENRKLALDYWNDLEQFLWKENITNTSILDGSGTTITIDIDSKNELEKKSFNTILDIAKKYKYNINVKSHSNKKVIEIPEEKSVDSNYFLNMIEAYLKNKIKVIDSDIVSITKSIDEKWSLKDTNFSTYDLDQVHICCGAWSDKLISNSPDLERPKVKSYFGLGSALLLESELPYIDLPKLDNIVRTPNRGGTCGIHAVQRKNNIYIGATNHITNLELNHAKIPGIKFLLEGSESVLGLDNSNLSLNILNGYRPVTLDTVPVIGKLANNVWCTYGTKRDGFTWAPYLARNFKKQLEGSLSNDWISLIELCNPFRSLISAGSVQHCIDLYVFNKTYEHYAHEGKMPNVDTTNFYEIAKIAHDKINKNLDAKIGLSPELVNIVYYTEDG